MSKDISVVSWVEFVSTHWQYAIEYHDGIDQVILCSIAILTVAMVGVIRTAKWKDAWSISGAIWLQSQRLPLR